MCFRACSATISEPLNVGISIILVWGRWGGRFSVEDVWGDVLPVEDGE
jgi:hypothetical protein